jgi:hypothetical protein
MNTEARDPILAGLDELAGLADADHVTDRLGGISRKARANRIRTRVAGAAAVAVVVAGGVGVVQLLPDGDKDVQPTPSPTTPANPSGLTIDLNVNQIGRTTLGVTYRIHGRSPELVYAPNETADVSGPISTRVLLNGEEAVGPVDAYVQCQAGTPKLPFDQTWSGDDGRGVIVTVPGPGTYEVSVQAPSCGADGKLVRNEATQTVTVTAPALVVADQASVDVDGDGRGDQVKLLTPSADQGGYSVAEVTRASGETTEVQVTGTGVPKIGGASDLNGDGVPEVEIVSEGQDRSWWTVLTYHRGEVVAAKSVLSGSEWVTKLETGDESESYDGTTYPWFQVIFMRDGHLMYGKTGDAWDRKSEVQVTLFEWGLDGSDLSLGGPQGKACISPDRATWANPHPC